MTYKAAGLSVLPLALFFFLPALNAQELDGLAERERENVLIKRVDENIEKFLRALKVIADKSSTETQRRKHLKIANSFFHDGSTIQVSKLNPDGSYDLRTMNARDYFTHLAALKYDKVVIELERVQTRSLRRMEGTTQEAYETNGYYEQIFRGYNDERLIYEDYTLKDIQIEILPEVGSYTGEKYWTIVFSHIKVVTTTKVKD